MHKQKKHLIYSYLKFTRLIRNMGLVLLLILKLRLPSNRPIAGTIRDKYGGQALHSFRKVENVWSKRDNTICYIDFLKIYYNSDTIPKFLRIEVYKRHLQRTTHVNALQRKLLKDELTFKNKHLEVLERELSAQWLNCNPIQAKLISVH